MADDEDEAPGVPEWVVTFGDMMSLLLTFFIMLVSLSEIKQVEKYQALVESIKKQLGHDASLVSMVPGQAKPRNSMVQQVANLARAKRKDLMKGGAKPKAPVGENRLVQIIRPGNRTSEGTTVFFDELSVVLSEDEKERLRVQAAKMKGKPQQIEVCGHVSQRPIPPGTKFNGQLVRDHMDFAYQRARTVAEFVQNDPALKIAPHRIRIKIASYYEPWHTGIDPELMKRNSRVDFFLLDQNSKLPENKPENRLQKVPADSIGKQAG